MTINLRISALLIAAGVVTSLTSVATAQQGYEFKLKLTAKNASIDPDGVWDNETLSSYTNPPVHPDIYTATIRTPSGTWLLTQTTADCNMQGMCTSLLVHIAKNGTKKVVANPQILQGGEATLSLNYRFITTMEIGEGGKPFKGTYKVEKP